MKGLRAGCTRAAPQVAESALRGAGGAAGLEGPQGWRGLRAGGATGLEGPQASPVCPVGGRRFLGTGGCVW